MAAFGGEVLKSAFFSRYIMQNSCFGDCFPAILRATDFVD
jgi:hypothetical protein